MGPKAHSQQSIPDGLCVVAQSRVCVTQVAACPGLGGLYTHFRVSQTTCPESTSLPLPQLLSTNQIVSLVGNGQAAFVVLDGLVVLANGGVGIAEVAHSAALARRVLQLSRNRQRRLVVLNGLLNRLAALRLRHGVPSRQLALADGVMHVAQVVTRAAL